MVCTSQGNRYEHVNSPNAGAYTRPSRGTGRYAHMHQNELNSEEDCSEDVEDGSQEEDTGFTSKYIQWTPQEDEQLRRLIEHHGARHWTVLAQHMPNRNSKSCRLRWVNQLRDDLKKGGFTPEEDEVIIRGHSEHGNKWTLIAKDLPGRTDNAVKNRWHATLRKRVDQADELRRRLQQAARIAQVSGQPAGAAYLQDLANKVTHKPQDIQAIQATLQDMGVAGGKDKASNVGNGATSSSHTRSGGAGKGRRDAADKQDEPADLNKLLATLKGNSDLVASEAGVEPLALLPASAAPSGMFGLNQTRNPAAVLSMAPPHAPSIAAYHAMVTSSNASVATPYATGATPCPPLCAATPGTAAASITSSCHSRSMMCPTPAVATAAAAEPSASVNSIKRFTSLNTPTPGASHDVGGDDDHVITRRTSSHRETSCGSTDHMRCPGDGTDHKIKAQNQHVWPGSALAPATQPAGSETLDAQPCGVDAAATAAAPHPLAGMTQDQIMKLMLLKQLYKQYQQQQQQQQKQTADVQQLAMTAPEPAAAPLPVQDDVQRVAASRRPGLDLSCDAVQGVMKSSGMDMDVDGPTGVTSQMPYIDDAPMIASASQVMPGTARSSLEMKRERSYATDLAHQAVSPHTKKVTTQPNEVPAVDGTPGLSAYVQASAEDPARPPSYAVQPGCSTLDQVLRASRSGHMADTLVLGSSTAAGMSNAVMAAGTNAAIASAGMNATILTQLANVGLQAILAQHAQQQQQHQNPKSLAKVTQQQHQDDLKAQMLDNFLQRMAEQQKQRAKAADLQQKLQAVAPPPPSVSSAGSDRVILVESSAEKGQSGEVSRNGDSCDKQDTSSSMGTASGRSGGRARGRKPGGKNKNSTSSVKKTVTFNSKSAANRAVGAVPLRMSLRNRSAPLREQPCGAPSSALDDVQHVKPEAHAAPQAHAGHQHHEHHEAADMLLHNAFGDPSALLGNMLQQQTHPQRAADAVGSGLLQHDHLAHDGLLVMPSEHHLDALCFGPDAEDFLGMSTPMGSFGDLSTLASIQEPGNAAAVQQHHHGVAAVPAPHHQQQQVCDINMLHGRQSLRLGQKSAVPFLIMEHHTNAHAFAAHTRAHSHGGAAAAAGQHVLGTQVSAGARVDASPQGQPGGLFHVGSHNNLSFSFQADPALRDMNAFANVFSSCASLDQLGDVSHGHDDVHDGDIANMFNGTGLH